MTDESSQPTYLVAADHDPIVIKVNGRASYLNCSHLNEFFQMNLKKGNTRFVVDLSGCTGVDSTFLGILAGIAVEVKKVGKEGSLVLTRLSDRNLELVRNLGLHRILTVEGCGVCSSVESSKMKATEEGVASASQILKAHESLVRIDASNESKFEDVMHFLKTQSNED